MFSWHIREKNWGSGFDPKGMNTMCTEHWQTYRPRRRWWRRLERELCMWKKAVVVCGGRICIRWTNSVAHSLLACLSCLGGWQMSFNSSMPNQVDILYCCYYYYSTKLKNRIKQRWNEYLILYWNAISLTLILNL